MKPDIRKIGNAVWICQGVHVNGNGETRSVVKIKKINPAPRKMHRFPGNVVKTEFKDGTETVEITLENNDNIFIENIAL